MIKRILTYLRLEGNSAADDTRESCTHHPRNRVAVVRASKRVKTSTKDLGHANKLTLGRPPIQSHPFKSDELEPSHRPTDRLLLYRLLISD